VPMFVRWRRYSRFKWKRDCYRQPDGQWHMSEWYQNPTGVVTQTAILLRSIRTKQGPRQEMVCRLGTIQEGSEHDPLQAKRFHGHVEINLSFAGIDGPDREKVLASLERVVPRPKIDPRRNRRD